MITTLLHLLRLFPFLCGGHRQLALENLALRHQLAVYKRTVPRPRLRRTDRLLWVWLARVWTGWRAALVIVAPDTVLRWQRRRFRAHWTKLSRRPTGGRPPVNAEIKALVTRMAAANPLWGAPRVSWRAAEAGDRGGRAHRLPAAPEAAHPAVPDRADVPRQPRPGPGLHGFLHGPHRELAGALRPGGPLDGPTDWGRLPRTTPRPLTSSAIATRST